jgi:hypothetical protein
MKASELLEEQAIMTVPSQSYAASHGREIPCERCRAPARVHILEGYTRGKPMRRHYCLTCADAAPHPTPLVSFEHVRSRLSIASMLVFAGLLLVALGIAVDQVGYHGSEGFGWKQTSSLVLGVFFVVLGALLHADLLAILGTVVFLVAVSADVYGPLGSPGFGWRQIAVILAGAVLIALGLYRRKQRLARHILEMETEAES